MVYALYGIYTFAIVLFDEIQCKDIFETFLVVDGIGPLGQI